MLVDLFIPQNDPRMPANRYRGR